jgi:hypothetical protein
MQIHHWHIQCTRGPRYVGTTVIFNTPHMCSMSRRAYRKLVEKAMKEIIDA